MRPARRFAVGLVRLVALVTMLRWGTQALSADEEPLVFSRDVRPILADKCFACHGPDEAKRQGGLRLDTFDAATAPADSGQAAIVAGQPERSELIHRIMVDNDTVRMPPPDSGKTLTDAQRGTLRRWVAEGAKYAQHWAFVPPARSEPPAVKNADWLRTPLDRFVLARLEREGLAPSPEADRVTLLRRLYLDLIGLPPTIEQVDAFLADQSTTAYEKVVEELLRSPHYGERWGRHWLDAARYADSDGFEKDKSRQMFFYRDWVVGAFNRDLPYDQFLIEQLAGDLLPDATQDQIVATGFLRNSMINEEGGVDPEQFRMEAMFDRMDAIGKSILGLTIQCAQCHTHKYDPLTQAEYYQLFAFLNNCHEAQRVVYTADEQMQAAELLRQIREAEAALQRSHPDWSERQAAWETAVVQGQPEWTVLELSNTGDNGQRYLPQGDGSLLAQGYAPTKFTATFKAPTQLQAITAIRLELLTDANLPCNGPGRSFKGTCALSEISVDVASTAKPDEKTRVKVIAASADVNPPEKELEPNFYDKTNDRRITGPVLLAIDGDPKTAWGIDIGPGRRNQARKAVFQLERPVGFAEGTDLHFSLQQNHGGWNSDDHMNHNLGRFRISVTTAANPAADAIPAAVREILAIPAAQRTPAQGAMVFSHWRTTVPEFAETNAQIEALWQRWPQGATSLTLAERQQPRATRVLKRGDWLKPADAVQPGVPTFLNPLPPEADGSRLGFARWVTDRRAPTTARVFVNRVWQAYFGLGLVSTSEDFGVQGEPPSHPELLDWLTVEFIDRGWRVKELQRQIVLSATYRQASRVTKESLARDPHNRLLARGARFRVEGEIVRDIALSASGLLNPQLGGRSVMPPAPEFLFLPPASYAPFPWVSETGPDRYRRGLYTFRRRSTPYPMLQTFDVPNADSSCVRRLRSNSPLQALVSLNEPVFFEAAQALARQALTHGGADDHARLAYAFRRVTARVPTVSELSHLKTLLQKQHERIAAGWLNAQTIAGGSAEKPVEPPPGATPTQLAAYTLVSRVLLNLDEAMTRE